jgi:ribosomal protein L37E
MLEMGELTNVGLGEQPRCGRCGAPAISVSKKLCQGCLEKLNAEMAQAQRTIKLKDKPQARIGEYDNKLTVVKTLEQKRNKS